MPFTKCLKATENSPVSHKLPTSLQQSELSEIWALRPRFVIVLVQIWDGHGLRKCLNLSALSLHGKVYDDGKKRSRASAIIYINTMYDCLTVFFFVFSAQFGCLSWSWCEKKLLYVAEKKNSAAERVCEEPACRKVLNFHTNSYTNTFTLSDESGCV